jgi:Tfp pilus assembly protein PilO
MKLEGKTKNVVIGAMLLLVVVAVAFWTLALSPKRDEAAKLGTQVKKLETSLAQHQAEVEVAEEARKEFPVAYQRLVVLGKAVPGDDETASLLVQLNRISEKAHVRLETLQIEPSSESGSESEASVPEGANGEPVSPTEASASLLSLGAAVGSAGLAVMPYKLTFQGDFFKMADFIEGLDELVKTTNEKVAVDGRLITVNGFVLEEAEAGFPDLEATFVVTTYLTPPSQGLTAGSAPEGPEGVTSVPASTTTGGAP